jgi:hypothetical protein
MGRLDDARLLLRRRRDSSAIEFALRAVVAREVERQVLPQPGFLRDVYQHDLARLIGAADLRKELDQTRQMSIRFTANWAIVSKWKVDSRYEVVDRHRSVGMIRAVGASSTGVLPWLRKYW